MKNHLPTRSRKGRSSLRGTGTPVCLAFMACAAAAAQAQTGDLPPVNVTDSRVVPGSSLGLDAPHGTGSRLGLSPRETPASVSSLTGADIAERNLTRAQDVAIRLPGVTESPAPGNGNTTLAARGFTGHNSVAQLVNGTRLVAASGTITYPFSSWPLESVEVLRGPASVLYGDGAIGAAINYTTKQPRFDRSEAEAFLSVGSFHTLEGGVGLRGPINEVLAYSAYLDVSTSDGYQHRFSDYKRRNYSLALTARPRGDLKVTLALDGGVNDDSRYFGTPLLQGQPDPRVRRINYNVDDSLVQFDDKVTRLSVEYQPGDSLRLRNETYYLTTDRHYRNIEAYAFNAAGTQVNRSDYLEILHSQHQVGNRFDATLDSTLAGHKNRFVAGVDWYRASLLHTNNSPFRGSSTVNPVIFDAGVFTSPDPTVPGRRSVLETTALFAENVLDLTPQWKLVAGVRHERMDFDNTDLRTGVHLVKEYAPTTGRLGLVWMASDALSLYGQYGTGTDPLSGALSLPNGGNTLDLTKGRQIEVGAKGSVPAVRSEWAVALYQIEKRNLLTRDPGNPNITLQVGQQSSRGIELAFAAQPLPGWTVDANAAFLRARFDDFNESVSGQLVSRAGNVPVGVPERTASLWTTWRFLPQWQAGVGARYVGKRQSNTANTTRLPAYTVLDASLAYTWSGNLNVALALKNLTDRDYALSGTGSVRWLMGAPRIVLYFVPFPSLGQAERLAGLPPLEVPAGCCLSAQEAAQRAGLHFTEARLGMHGPTPVWRLLAPDGGRPRWRTVEAGTGTLLPMLGPEEAAAVAAAFSQRWAVQTDMLERDQWTVAQGLDSHRPLFKVALDGADGLELYVSPGAGEVVRDTRRSERFWNWLGAVPHWIYPTVLRQFPKAWHQVVVWTSIAAVLLAATGMLLGVWQLFLNRNRWIPYRKFWMRWHHIAGLVAAIFTLTWIFSGLMSMNPFGVFSSRGVPSSERMQWLGAAAPALDNPTAAVRQARAHGFAPRELDMVQVAGQAWYRLRDAERQLLVRAEVGVAAQEPVAAVPDATVLAALAGLRSELGMPAVRRLDAYDGMYYARHPGSPDVRHTRPLPVWRAEWSDGVAVYADPASARILLRADSSTQWQRVLYNGLHSFDFAPLLAWPWVRHGLVVGLSLLGLALCITSCVVAWRVLVPRASRSAAARRTIAQGER